MKKNAFVVAPAPLECLFVAASFSLIFNTGKYRLNVLDRGAIVSTVLHSPRSQRKILGIDPLYEKTLGTDYQGEFTQKVFLNANDCFISITSNSPDPVNITNIQLNATFSPRKRSSSEV